MVTIKDIARESGYSVSTVSRVLNNRSDVSLDAKKKIEEVVEKFHFVPNNNAKHLKQNNSKSIGVLVKGISNMLFAGIVEEIQQMIEKTEYTLVVSYVDEDADEVEQARAKLLDMQAKEIEAKINQRDRQQEGEQDEV